LHCTDKSSSAELAEAINLMFRWYREAAKCSVYLSDGSIRGYDENDHFSQFTWESDFGKANGSLGAGRFKSLLLRHRFEFFSLEGKRLSDKKSLERQVHEITGIAIQALQGNPQSDFGVTDRMSWCYEHRLYRLLAVRPWRTLGCLLYLVALLHFPSFFRFDVLV
jgi:hypothetical protein